MAVPTEMPKGYVVPPLEEQTIVKRDPAIQAMMDGESVIALKGSTIRPKRSKRINDYYEVEDPSSTYHTRSAIPDGESKIDVKPDPVALVSFWALLSPMRQFVIDKVKAPLQNVIEGAKTFSDISGQLFSSLGKIPAITKKNTCFFNTHILLREQELFNQYYINPGRTKLLNAGFKLFEFEYEHDGHYAWLADWLLIDLALEIAKGNWKPRFSKFPQSGCWQGPDLPDIETIREKMREALKE